MDKLPRTELKIYYTPSDKTEKTDITKEISSYIKGFTYTDNAADFVDDISLQLHDAFETWVREWKPKKTDKITAYIGKLYCGEFQIDEIEFRGYPKELDLKAVSGFTTKPIRREKKTRAWESVTLKEIAAGIAKAAEMELQYYIESDDFNYDRIDQHEESDLAFLKRLCENAGLKLKVEASSIIVYDAKMFEKREISFALNGSNILGYSFKTQNHDTYSACRVEYYDNDEKKVKKYTYVADYVGGDIDKSKVLVVKQRVKTLAEAKQLAENKLNERNRFETVAYFTVGINLPADVIIAGTTFSVDDFGMFDGKYIVDKATHSVSSGYTIQIESHKVLEE